MATEVSDRLVVERTASRLLLAWYRSGLKLNEVAERSQVSRTALYRYMTGQTLISSWALMRVCPVLGVSADWLLGTGASRGFVPQGSTLGHPAVRSGRDGR